MESAAFMLGTIKHGQTEGQNMENNHSPNSRLLETF